MIDKKLVERIMQEYSIKRSFAQQRADEYKDKAMQIEQYANLERQIKGLVFEIGKRKFEKKDTFELEAKMENLKQEQKHVLKQNGIDESLLYPVYSCAKCKDTGYINGEMCSCLKQEYNNIIMKNANINFDEISDLGAYDLSVFSDEEKQNIESIVNNLKNFADTFEDAKIKNIVLLGSSGVGKTYLSQSFAKEMLKKNVPTLFLSSFTLNNMFLKIHTSQSLNKTDGLNNCINSELLIIDDLGTEPILRNVTKEYLLVLLNERALKNKSTIITSNLTPEAIIDRYGERIFSRIFNKANTAIFNLNGKDLRLKK